MPHSQISWQFTHPIGWMEPCATNRATERAQALAGAGICDLSIGDVKFDTPEHIKQAAIRSITENDTHYGPVQGTLELRKAIAGKFLRENGLDYAPEEIVVGNGAGQLMFAALFATLGDGDEVIIPAPCWDNYGDMVLLNRGVPRFVTATGGRRVGVRDIVAAITPRTRWIILNNPNNPGGFIWEDEELRELAGVLGSLANNIAVMSDETFEKLCFGARRPLSFAALPGMRQRTLTVNGLSKSHAMSGWRIGYAAGPRRLIEKITLFSANTTYSVCSVAQAAAAAALKPSFETETALTSLKSHIMQSRYAACSRLSLLSNVAFSWPEAGYFVLLDVRPLLGIVPGNPAGFRTVQELCDHLLTHAAVVATDGAGFQAPGHIRLSFAGPEQMIAAAFDRIVRVLITLPLGLEAAARGTEDRGQAVGQG